VFACLGRCSAVDAEWIDTIALRSPGVPDGKTGSFVAELAVDAVLAAVLPDGWSSYVGTQVRATWSASVWIDGTRRDQLVVNCFGALGVACSPSGVRTYYPSGGDPELTPLAVDDGTFALGPYDFIWGQPFTIDVRLQVTNVSLALVSLHDAGGAGGNAVPISGVRASATSGSDWLGVTLPEPADAADAAVAALALATVSKSARAGRRHGA
jgi:hypothetical protein